MGNCIENNLKKQTMESCEELTFKGQKLKCKVIEVYDGDTVTLAFKFRGKYFKKRCRLHGINSPEIRTRDREEKKQGFLAKDHLKEMIDGKIIILDCFGWDKYGRLLGNIYMGKICINDKMMEDGFAEKYELK